MRVGGIIQVKINGEIQRAKGDFDYNLGRPLRETVAGVDGVHGYKEMPQPAFIEGTITDNVDLDLASLVGTKGAVVTVALANGKTVVLRNAWFEGEGTANTEEGEIEVRFASSIGEEIT